MPPPACRKTERMNDSTQALAPDARLIARWLAALGVPADPQAMTQALTQAAAQTQAQFAPTRAVEWLRDLFERARLTGLAPVQLAWRRLDKQRLPALVWHAGDWHLALKADAQQATLVDATGQQRLLEDQDLQAALVMWLRPASTGTDMSGLRNPAARMVLREMFRDSGWVSKVVVATIIVNLIAVAGSLFSMQVYDRVVPTLAYATLTTLVAGMAMVVVLDWALKTIRARILDSLSCAVDKRLSQQVFDHLLHLQLDLQPRSVGALAAQVTGLDSVRQFFSSGVVFALVDLPFALMFIAFIALIGGQVALVYALLLPLAMLIGWATQARLRRLVVQQLTRSNERQGLLVDAIRGAEAIRAANAAWRFSSEWQAITASIDAYSIQQKATHSAMATTIGSLSTVAYVAAVVVGVWQVEAGHLSMGAIVACSILGGRVIAPIAQGVQYLAQWQQVTQSLQMVNHILAVATERRPGQTLLSPTLARAGLRYEADKLRYAYPGSPIQQVNLAGSLQFRAGERVLLLGPVGCGKSTLLKLMAGLYRPREGRVRLDDTDLWEIDPQVVASQLGYLPQGVHLFKGTLRSNLTLSGMAGDAQVSELARELGLDDIAAGSPLGMDLPIGEGGEGLSGGQRQLVALARVMLSQPRVWLLDEPTASLDAESEAKVWAALAEHVAEQDILIVATHRPAQAAAIATRVLVMQRGEVVRDGRPAELMPQMYAKAAVTPLPAKHWQRAGVIDVI